MPAMDWVHAKLVHDTCPECLNALLEEAKILGLPLAGEVVIIPEHWLNPVCTHGRKGIKFERSVNDTDLPRKSLRAKTGEVDADVIDTRMDKTKDVGYPARDHGYGSHPMEDDFDDESGIDGSGTYPGVKRH
jgi:hypothetical protein